MRAIGLGFLIGAVCCGTAAYAQGGHAGTEDMHPHKVEAQKARDDAAKAALAAAVATQQAADAAEAAEDQRIVAGGGLVRVKQTGELWSGEGDGWSQWYSVASDPAPAGYVFHDAVFRLVGDRCCGTVTCPTGQWANCGQKALTKEGATWQFRMQGHSDAKRFIVDNVSIPGSNNSPIDIQFHVNGTKATSVGILKSRYVVATPVANPQ